MQLKAQSDNPPSAMDQEASEAWKTPGLSGSRAEKGEETAQFAAFWKVCVNKKGQSVGEGKAL